MQQTYEVTYRQMVLIGLGVGFVLGLIPLALGFYRGQRKLAIIGFAASVVAGAAWSLFSLIIVLVFVWLILRNPSARAAEGASAAALPSAADEARSSANADVDAQ